MFIIFINQIFQNQKNVTKKVSISETKDRSTTLYHSEFNEHYHSQHGALQESMHVFINNGLFLVKKDSINIFEMGFGTGLNAYLTLLNSTIDVHYDCIDTYKLDSEVVSKLNFPSLLSADPNLFNALHQSDWDKDISISSSFILHKYYQDFSSFIFSKSYDLIFYDAFSPRIQPHMWTDDVLKKVVDTLTPGGLFVTYCAKSSIRKCLMNFGLNVEKCPGPPGKREMIRAFKL